MNPSRSLAALACFMLLSGCTAGRSMTARVTATPAPASTSESNAENIDLAVRQVLQGYLGALSRGDYATAAAYWSPAANMKPADLAVRGVSGWFFLSSEMINTTPTSAYVQLNFTVNVQQGAPPGYVAGRNVRYVRLNREDGTWKIQRMSATPEK